MNNYFKELQWEQFKQEESKATHLLALIQKNDGELPEDSPLPFEDKMLALMLPFFTTAFNTYFTALKQTRLLEIAFSLAYSPSMSEEVITARMRNVIRLLSNPFSIAWAKGKEADLRRVVQDMYSAARTKAAAKVGLPETERDAKDTQIEDHHTALATIWTSMGIQQTVIPTTVTRLTREALRAEMDSTQARDFFMGAIAGTVLAGAGVYYGALSTTVVNGTRSFSRTYEFQRLGVTYAVWNTAGDERVCAVCEMLDGMVFRVDDVAAAMERSMAASTREELIEVHPFISRLDTDTNEFVFGTGERLSADVESEVLAQAGVTPGGVHPSCRCELSVFSS